MPVDNLSETMQVIGQYDLVEKIAEGGMGTVYRGTNRLTGETVAIKVVPQHLLSNTVVLKRFEQEYSVARTIEHPNIVKALDYGREGDVRYLVMEFVDGESLGQKIERGGAMNEDAAIQIITQVANALGRAHQLNIIHRDVKPDNILVTADGTVKLTDLGLVKELEADQNLTRTGRGLGTPHFMAPEQFRNAKKADARCDIYSLGATLYMMVTGELPFKSNGPLDAWMKKINNEIEAPRVFAPALSERVDWAIRRAMSPDPIHRPECCREFVEDLTGHSTGNLSGTTPGMDALSDCWWLVYTDEDGVEHTIKATEKGIRRSLKENRLGDAAQVRVSRLKTGPYTSLRSQPEFRDLVIVPENVVTPKSKASEAQVVPPLLPPLAKVPAPRPNSAASDACVVTPSKVMASVQQAISVPQVGSGPCIQLKSSAQGTEFGKWALLAAIFIGGGIIAAALVPFLPYARFFLRALFS